MGRIFGPVASRRLGRSLGIDVIPYKTCSFDCVYCECGRTSDLTVRRAEFYPVEQILGELGARLSRLQGGLDVLTLSGAGEPTLYSGMGRLISGIKEISDLPVAVITNGSLLWLEEVREELSLADIVVPSLDAALATAFKKINRPHASLDLARIMEGIKAFVDGYGGEIRFEILLIDGYNTGSGEIEALRRFISGLRVDSIQLNTAVRPGTVEGVSALTGERLRELQEVFGPKCEIVASVSTRAAHEDEAGASHILSMIERRPCTADDIAAALGLPVVQVVKAMDSMTADGTVVPAVKDGKTWYTASDRASD